MVKINTDMDDGFLLKIFGLSKKSEIKATAEIGI